MDVLCQCQSGWLLVSRKLSSKAIPFITRLCLIISQATVLNSRWTSGECFLKDLMEHKSESYVFHGPSATQYCLHSKKVLHAWQNRIRKHCNGTIFAAWRFDRITSFALAVGRFSFRVVSVVYSSSQSHVLVMEGQPLTVVSFHARPCGTVQWHWCIMWCERIYLAQSRIAHFLKYLHGAVQKNTETWHLSVTHASIAFLMHGKTGFAKLYNETGPSAWQSNITIKSTLTVDRFRFRVGFVMYSCKYTFTCCFTDR